MLTKRGQILFDRQEWLMLQTIARNEETSVGQLVRAAVNKTYGRKFTRNPQVINALENIKKIRPKPFNGIIDYEELINYGREQ